MAVMHLLFGLWPHDFVLAEDFLLIPLMPICFFFDFPTFAGLVQIYNPQGCPNFCLSHSFSNFRVFDLAGFLSFDF